MTTERDRDPLERLRTSNPVPAAGVAELMRSPERESLYRRIVASDPTVAVGARVRPSVPTSVGRRRVRRTVRLAGLSAAVLLTVAVGAYAVAERRPSKSHTAACFAEADLVAGTAVVVVDERGPVAACADIWAGGGFGAVPTPPLRACTLDSGVVGVFPETSGGDVCLDLGLEVVSASSDPDQAAEDARFLAFTDAVVARFLDQGCVPSDRAAAIVREELQRAGLGSWTVSTGPGRFTADRPCAQLSFQPESRTVSLVPAPPR